MRLRNKPELEAELRADKQVLYKLEEQRKASDLFANANKLRLEIGTGRGSFIVKLAKRYPEINFIALEKVKEALAKPIELAKEEELANLAFIYGDAKDLLDYFKKDQLERIYLNFSSPWPKRKHLKRRLTHPRFTKLYHKVLITGGKIELKTDSADFFKFSIKHFSQNGFLLKNVTYDLHHSKFKADNIITEYERRWLEKGRGILRLEAVNTSKKD